MYCSHCGKETIPNMAFCSYCGNALATTEDNSPKQLTTKSPKSSSHKILTIVLAIVSISLLTVWGINRAKSASENDVITFGSYELDGDTSNGAEPIEWEVLAEREDGAKLLVSKYLLTSMPYNEKLEDITWEECTLRSWLNEEFYEQAFTPRSKKKFS